MGAGSVAESPSLANVKSGFGGLRAPSERTDSRWWPFLLSVFGLALLVRLFFSLLTSDLFDRDEFVYLGLGHAFAIGRAPYEDFNFPHPPGLLIFLRLIDPLISVWWPLGRLAFAAVDSVTAALVCLLARRLWGNRAALAAGGIYAVNPIVLLAGTRVDVDVLMTCLGVTGLALLTSDNSRRNDVLAGVFLALALWTKYPALLFVPAYLLAAPRRVFSWGIACLVALAFLFLPFLSAWHALYDQTVAWQALHRVPNNWPAKLEKLTVFWLLASPLALYALARRQGPSWATAGFVAGALYLASPLIYYHYFLPMAAFGAVLSAPLALQLFARFRWTLAAILLVVIGLVAFDLDQRGPVVDLVAPARFSHIEPALSLIERNTRPDSPLLGDQLEYSFLLKRPPLAHYYYWNLWQSVTPRYLESFVPRASAVVRSTESPGNTYPDGFSNYMNRHYGWRWYEGAQVWLVSEHKT